MPDSWRAVASAMTAACGLSAVAGKARTAATICCATRICSASRSGSLLGPTETPSSPQAAAGDDNAWPPIMTMNRIGNAIGSASSPTAYVALPAMTHATASFVYVSRRSTGVRTV